MLGSDEIWNIRRDACRFPVFWGDGCQAFLISYAPSVNQSESEDFRAYPGFIDSLMKIDQLSVRDQHSRDVIKTLTRREADLVLDPTLLVKPDEEEYSADTPYIAVYVFEGSLTKEEKKQNYSICT